MKHLLLSANMALVVGRYGAAMGDEEWNVVFISQQIVDLNIYRRGGGEVHLLYLYDSAEGRVGCGRVGVR